MFPRRPRDLRQLRRRQRRLHQRLLNVRRRRQFAPARPDKSISHALRRYSRARHDREREHSRRRQPESSRSRRPYLHLIPTVRLARTRLYGPRIPERFSESRRGCRRGGSLARARAQKAFPVRTRRKSGRLHAKLDDGRDGIRAEFHGGCGEEEGDDDYALDPIARGDAHAASPASECGNQKQTVGRKQLSSETRELGLEIAWYKN